MSENSEESTQPINQSSVGKPKKKRSVKKIIGYIVVGIVALFVVSTFFVNSATKAPLAVSNEFLNNMQAGNSAGAYALFSSGAKQVVPVDQFDTVVGQVGPILNSSEKVTGKKIDGETGKPASSEITYEIKGTDGKTYVVIVNLTKENDNWKILSFDSKVK